MAPNSYQIKMIRKRKKSAHQANGKSNQTGYVIISMIVTVLISVCSWAQEGYMPVKRFNFSGDGSLYMFSERTNLSFEGQYRTNSEGYDKAAIEKICQVFGAPSPDSPLGLSLRFVEFLDYLQDHFNPKAKITITSGYRNPEYNTLLRDRGKLAAKASLHQYGMAADLKIEGVRAKALWNYLKSLKFGGAGYYNGSAVHVDVGPARFWDQNTSGVGTGISDDNKLICLVSDFDVYQPGDTVVLRFIRMTAFPIQVQPEFSLVSLKGRGNGRSEHPFTPEFSVPHKEKGPEFNNMAQMDRIRWHMPNDIPPGHYTIKAKFYGDQWKEMPKEIETLEIKIKK